MTPSPQRLTPTPETAGRCPRCDRPLVVGRLRLPGWRMLVDGRCGDCGHRYLQDLPSGHGLVCPAALDLDTGELFGGAPGEPFREALKSGWEAPDIGPVRLEVRTRRPASRATLLNCLDPVWGRSVLELSNVHRELRSGRDVIALVPGSLAHLVPDAATEVWAVHEPPRRLGGWLAELERRLARELERLGDCVLSAAAPHPDPSTHDLDERFAGPVDHAETAGPTPGRSLRGAGRRRPLRTARGLTVEALDRRRERAGERALRRRVDAVALPAVLEDRRGHVFELVTQEEVEQFARHGGHFEAGAIELARRTLRPGMTAFDIGANIGAFTIPLARAVAPAGRVHAFEPGPGTARRLRRTLSLNSIENVAVNEAAVSDAPGELELFGYGDGYESWATLAPREIETPGGLLTATQRWRVETETLDAYCARHRIERIDTLKIDVEGAEPRVLAGAASLLEHDAVDLMLLELNDEMLSAFGERAHHVVDRLERAGLICLRLDGDEVVRPFRAAGWVEQLTTLVACNTRGLARLRSAGAVPD